MPKPRINRFAAPVHEDIEYILENLRPEDVFELGCSGVLNNPALFFDVLDMSTLDYVWFVDGKPAFAFGIIRPLQDSHVGHLWGIGTPDTKLVIPRATKWGLQNWLPDAFEKHGVRRIEVRVPLQSEHSIRWLLRLGMTVEAPLVLDCAINGEPMVQLAYTTREYKRDYVLPTTGTGDNAGAPDADENEHPGTA